MKMKLFVVLLVAVICIFLVGCQKSEKTVDNSKLNEAYNKVGEYFANENINRSNLGAYYIDTEKNIIVVVLLDNNKEKQNEFIKISKVDSKYIKFVQGGPYTTSNHIRSSIEI